MTAAARRFLVREGPSITGFPGVWRSSLAVSKVDGSAVCVRAAAFNAAAARGGGAAPVEVSMDGHNFRVSFDGTRLDASEAIEAAFAAAENVLRPVRIADGCTGCRRLWGAPGSEGQCRRCRRCLNCCDDDGVSHSCGDRRAKLERRPGAAARSDRARKALADGTWREPGTSASEAWQYRKTRP